MRRVLISWKQRLRRKIYPTPFSIELGILKRYFRRASVSIHTPMPNTHIANRCRYAIHCHCASPKGLKTANATTTKVVLTTRTFIVSRLSLPICITNKKYGIITSWGRIYFVTRHKKMQNIPVTCGNEKTIVLLQPK